MTTTKTQAKLLKGLSKVMLAIDNERYDDDNFDYVLQCIEWDNGIYSIAQCAYDMASNDALRANMASVHGSVECNIRTTRKQKTILLRLSKTLASICNEQLKSTEFNNCMDNIDWSEDYLSISREAHNISIGSPSKHTFYSAVADKEFYGTRAEWKRTIAEHENH